jgi:hypothetical protein
MGELSPLSATEIVAHKLAQFGQSRREIVHAIGRKSNKAVPPEIVEEFFNAVEAGQWDEIDRRFGAMTRRSEQHAGFAPAPEMEEFWSAVFETHGAAEQVHLWPAQKLLDSGLTSTVDRFEIPNEDCFWTQCGQLEVLIISAQKPCSPR